MRMPVLMGAVMGAMMLWMLHGALVGDGVGGTALVMFALAHVVVFGLIALAAVFMARLSPRLRGWLARVHRPKLRHLSVMMGSALVTVTVVHVAAHGVSAWT